MGKSAPAHVILKHKSKLGERRRERKSSCLSAYMAVLVRLRPVACLGGSEDFWRIRDRAHAILLEAASDASYFVDMSLLGCALLVRCSFCSRRHLAKVYRCTRKSMMITDEVLDGISPPFPNSCAKQDGESIALKRDR